MKKTNIFFCFSLHILQIDYPQKFENTKTDDIVHKSFLEQKIHTFCIRPHHTTYFPSIFTSQIIKMALYFFSQFLNSLMYNNKNEIFSLYIKFHSYHFFLRQPKTNKILYFCARKRSLLLLAIILQYQIRWKKIAIPFFTIFFL